MKQKIMWLISFLLMSINAFANPILCYEIDKQSLKKITNRYEEFRLKEGGSQMLLAVKETGRKDFLGIATLQHIATTKGRDGYDKVEYQYSSGYGDAISLTFAEEPKPNVKHFYIALLSAYSDHHIEKILMQCLAKSPIGERK